MKKTIVLLLFLFSVLDLFSQQSQKFYNVQNLDINTEYADFGVTFYKGSQVLFASSMKDRTIKRRERSYNRMEFLQFYKGIVKEDGQIIAVTKFSTEKFNLFHESDITFANDGKTIFFTFNNYINNEYRKTFLFSTAKKHILNIFKANVNESGIVSNLTPLPFNGKNYSISHPRLSPDGKTLFFISDMEGSYGGTDIYKVSILPDGGYSTPENLGLKINTAGNEMFPFLSNNNIFYFSSDGHPGKGGLDIFSSKLENNEFSQVENLNQLNYTDDDFAFVINEELNVGYFSSMREGNKGNVDIFSFNVKQIECNQTITGIIKNNKTGKTLVNAKVELFVNNKLIETSISNGSGTYTFATICETAYTIKASKTDFVQEEKMHTSSKVKEETSEINFYLEPFECNQTITGIIKNNKTGQTLANAKVELFINNKLIETSISNGNGTYTFATVCETAYTVKASKTDFIQEEKMHTSSKTNTKTNEINLNLKPVECNQTIAGIVINNETGKVLPNTEVRLFVNNKLVGTSISNENGAYTFATICKTAYTIKAFKTDFVQEEKKHTSSRVNKGISEINFNIEPLECNQTIAGIVTNQKTNGVIANAEILLMKNGIVLDKITSFTDGSFKFKELLGCNSEYTIIARHIDFESKTNAIKTDAKISKENYTNFPLIKVEVIAEFITEKDVILIKTNPIYFDLNKSDIRQDAAIELNKVVKLMKDNPTIKVELNTHTDSRAPDDYNMRLSNDRARSSINYLISQGINPSRLSGKGYGETRLQNKCSNGIKCTNAEHEENRRTEFIVINK